MNVPNDSLPQLPPSQEGTDRLIELNLRVQAGEWRTPQYHLDRAHLEVVERDQNLVRAVRFARDGNVDLAENAIRLWCGWEGRARESVGRARVLIPEAEVDREAER